MNIGKLQQQAASSVDELLSISGDMDAYVIKAYGQAPQEIVAMQCRIQLERLKRLGKKLAEIREALVHVTEPEDGSEESPSRQPEGGGDGKPRKTCAMAAQQGGKPKGICALTAQQAGRMEISGMPSSAVGLSMEQRHSISVTEQLIAQNLLLIAQKEELLKGFLAHSDMVGIQQKRAKELQDMTEIIRLKEALQNNL